MMYLLALILPPIALFAVGKPIQGIINLIFFGVAAVLWFLTLGFLSFITFPIWIICIIHGVFVTHGVMQERKMREIAAEVSVGPMDG